MSWLFVPQASQKSLYRRTTDMQKSAELTGGSQHIGK
jgi:hypothetical protein